MVLCGTSYFDFPCSPCAVSSLDAETFPEKSGTAVLYFTLIHNLEFPCNPVSSSGEDMGITLSDMSPILSTTAGYIAIKIIVTPCNSKLVHIYIHPSMHALYTTCHA